MSLLDLLPGLVPPIQGRLAEARLTLGLTPQPFQGSRRLRQEGRKGAKMRLHQVPFMPGITDANNKGPAYRNVDNERAVLNGKNFISAFPEP
jgi:hypothetical protein